MLLLYILYIHKFYSEFYSEFCNISKFQKCLLNLIFFINLMSLYNIFKIIHEIYGK